MAQVLVVERDAFFGGAWPHGFHRLPDPAKGEPHFLQRALRLGRFVERQQAEADPSLKQWIPYCMLRCGDWGRDGDPASRGVFLVQRTKGQTEARLHGSWSVGLGGHIEPDDGDPPAMAHDPAGYFAAALLRELREELVLDGVRAPSPRLLGLLNDDSDSVGQVHAGLAYCMDLQLPLASARQQVGIREISKMRGGFTSLVEIAGLWQTHELFESWSQFLIGAEIVDATGGCSWSGAVVEDD